MVLTMDAEKDVVNVTRINITATRSTGAPYTASFTPPPLDGSGPPPSFFERITLAGWEGRIRVTAEGLGPDLAPVAAGSADVDLEAESVVAAHVTLELPAGGGASDAGTSADSGEAASTASANPSR